VEYIKKVAADEQLYLKHTGWKQLPEAQWSEVGAVCREDSAHSALVEVHDGALSVLLQPILLCSPFESCTL